MMRSSAPAASLPATFRLERPPAAIPHGLPSRRPHFPDDVPVEGEVPSRPTDHTRQLSTIVRWIAASGAKDPEPGEKRGQIGAEAFNQVAAFLDQHRRQTQGGYL